MDEAQMAELQVLRERVVEVQGLQVTPACRAGLLSSGQRLQMKLLRTMSCFRHKGARAMCTRL